ncbi:formin-like protein 18 isoform X2 [Amphibalanus amphitrite]|uniref:formin-like protein 18 isoform X2 n=1 Tax=Amphibalanus amphitrite TaxID=1232801 RepID=UPI001C92418C|nr:formin-like protein 18 isoform X2 [Amphibalanus amphitrite]
MVRGPIPSLRTWEERQGCGPPLHSTAPSNGLKRSKPVNVPKPMPSLAEREVIIESRSEGRQMKQSVPPPPPPPPENGRARDSITIYSTPTLAKLAQTQQPAKAATPLTPSISNGIHNGANSSRTQAGVETESLDSFTLEHPPPAAPKPPPTYFDGAPRKRDVLVSIGSYGDSRPAPSRLQFLGSQKGAEDSNGSKFEEVTTQLQHELVQTLSRSNLRHRTGSMDNLLSDGGASTRRTVTDKYGSVLNISDSGADSGPGGGILKNGTARSSSKSISFGKTTMIGDVPVTVL